MGQGGRISNSGGFAVWMDAWDHRDILSPGGKSARDTIFWLVCLPSTRVCQLPEHGDTSRLSAVYSESLDPSQAHSRCSGKGVDAHQMESGRPQVRRSCILCLGFCLDNLIRTELCPLKILRGIQTPNVTVSGDRAS